MSLHAILVWHWSLLRLHSLTIWSKIHLVKSALLLHLLALIHQLLPRLLTLIWKQVLVMTLILLLLQLLHEQRWLLKLRSAFIILELGVLILRSALLFLDLISAILLIIWDVTILLMTGIASQTEWNALSRLRLFKLIGNDSLTNVLGWLVSLPFGLFFLLSFEGFYRSCVVLALEDVSFHFSLVCMHPFVGILSQKCEFFRVIRTNSLVAWQCCRDSIRVQLV